MASPSGDISGKKVEVRANGYMGGYVEFDGQFVTIGHAGVSRLVAGGGVKRVHIGQIGAIQLKPAGLISNGFIQFAISGSPELRSRVGRRTYEAGQDENSVVFTRKHQSEFETLQKAVEQAKVTSHAPSGQFQQPDLAGQLNALWQLVQQGALSPQEFEAQKARLLGGPPPTRPHGWG